MLVVKTPEELKAHIGETFGPSDWITIDQDRINAFADCTGDHQFIHTDVEMATPIFGGTIAHGYLTLSLLVPLAAQILPHMQNAKMGMNYGLNKLRFITPVLAGSQMNVVGKLLDVTDKGSNRYLLTYEVTANIKDAPKPAYVAELLSMIVLG